MRDYPPILLEFSNYKIAVQGRSKLTVEQYLIDLDQFFRYIICSRKRKNHRFSMEEFEEQTLSSVDVALCGTVTSGEIIAFVGWEASERDNKPAARARKLSAIRSFYKFLTSSKRYLENNPARDIESPRVKQALPKFLTLEESLRLQGTGQYSGLLA